VLIHAAKGMTRLEYSAAALVFRQAGIRQYFPRAEELQRGGIVDVAEVAGCVPPERRTSYWHMLGCHGVALRGAQPLTFTPLAGRLGLFDVPADVLSPLFGTNNFP